MGVYRKETEDRQDVRFAVEQRDYTILSRFLAKNQVSLFWCKDKEEIGKKGITFISPNPFLWQTFFGQEIERTAFCQTTIDILNKYSIPFLLCVQAIIYLTALMKKITQNTNKGYQNGLEVKRLKNKKKW